jgi:DNA-directed RNA polymerase subunit RPC12/RpoP
MATWELQCPNCKNKFAYMRITDDDLENYYLPLRPIFPEDGLEVECPDCSFKAVYQRYALTIAV